MKIWHGRPVPFLSSNRRLISLKEEKNINKREIHYNIIEVSKLLDNDIEEFSFPQNIVKWAICESKFPIFPDYFASWNFLPFTQITRPVSSLFPSLVYSLYALLFPAIQNPESNVLYVAENSNLTFNIKYKMYINYK